MTPRRKVPEPARLMVTIPGALKERLLHAAVDQHRMAADLVTDALTAYLAKHDKRTHEKT